MSFEKSGHIANIALSPTDEKASMLASKKYPVMRKPR